MLKAKFRDLKNIKLIPKDTCIFEIEGLLSLRLNLDKAYLDDAFAKFDQPLVLYSGPQSLQQLSCNSCNAILFSAKECGEPI